MLSFICFGISILLFSKCSQSIPFNVFIQIENYTESDSNISNNHLQQKTHPTHQNTFSKIKLFQESIFFKNQTFKNNVGNIYCLGSLDGIIVPFYALPVTRLQHSKIKGKEMPGNRFHFIYIIYYIYIYIYIGAANTNLCRYIYIYIYILV